MSTHDVIVIGGGHNGLACAAYLAKAGSDVLVRERRGVLGGAAVTEEQWPGYQVSSASYVVSLMPPRIVSELELERFGYRVSLLDPDYWIPGRSTKDAFSASHIDERFIQAERLDPRREVAQYSHDLGGYVGVALEAGWHDQSVRAAAQRLDHRHRAAYAVWSRLVACGQHHAAAAARTDQHGSSPQCGIVELFD
jgi:phytoene dehydrogenase-like protein